MSFSRKIYIESIIAHEIFISPFILQELKQNLQKKLHYTVTETQTTLQFIEQYATEIKDVDKLSAPVSRDRDDDNILALAVRAQADFIITGDNDLVVLQQFRGIKIIKPNAFWRTIDV